jgi:hypothetical protein
VAIAPAPPPATAHTAPTVSNFMCLRMNVIRASLGFALGYRRELGNGVQGQGQVKVSCV